MYKDWLWWLNYVVLITYNPIAFTWIFRNYSNIWASWALECWTAPNNHVGIWAALSIQWAGSRYRHLFSSESLIIEVQLTQENTENTDKYREKDILKSRFYALLHPWWLHRNSHIVNWNTQWELRTTMSNLGAIPDHLLLLRYG